MEGKLIHKKLYTRKIATIGEDRISNLPDTVLYHILSFIDMARLLPTNLVSRRFRYLVKSLPTLNFDENIWSRSRGIKSYQMGFIHFVTRVLLLHDDSSIQKICFAAGFDDQLAICFTAIERRNVQEVHLFISSQNHIILSHCLFVSTIRVFTIRFNKKISDYVVHLPHSICSSTHLKKLELEYAILPKGNSSGELVLKWPLLEKLVISNCDHGKISVLTISALNLKKLVLKNEVINKNSIAGCKIKIHAPILTTLEFKGEMYKDYYMENFSSSITADIGLRIDEKWHAKCMAQILEALLDVVSSLTLHGRWFQSSSGFSDALKQLPGSFTCLQHLKLISWNNSNITAMANLLKRSSHIETFTIDIFKESDKSSISETDWGDDLSFQCSLHQLKSFVIQNFKGWENEFLLIKFVLQNAMALEMIIIIANEALSRDKEGVSETIWKLQCLPRRCVIIHLLWKNIDQWITTVIP